MIIETKYEPGEYVWHMNGEEIKYALYIRSIEIREDKNITYYCVEVKGDNGPWYPKVYENNILGKLSKEEIEEHISKRNKR